LAGETVRGEWISFSGTLLFGSTPHSFPLIGGQHVDMWWQLLLFTN
jgi:hypothetical protein